MVVRFPGHILAWLGIILVGLAAGSAMAADEPCLGCHAGLSAQQVTDWRSSNHATSLDTLLAAPGATDDCLQCHSADYRADPDNVTLATAVYPNSCSACHLDHVTEGRFAGDKGTHELSKPKNVICVDCHSASGAQPGQTPPSSQVEIFTGTGGVGVSDSPGIHSNIMADGCVTCHLSDHTFRADTAVCAKCHVTNAEAKLTEARDKVQGKLDELLPLLDSFEDKVSQDYLDAKFNIDLVRISNDFGAHNLGYSDSLLSHSESLLKQAPVEPQPVEESCLTCHRGLNPVQVESWEGSDHAESLEHLLESPEATDDCLQCHSTDFRLDPENVTLATATLPNSCSTCHVDHVSEGRFTGSKETHELVAAKKQLCIDCHASGGAQPGETPPSSQYEIFTGTGGVGVPDMPGTHSFMPDGCLSCHLSAEEGVTDHEFHVDGLDDCTSCHPDIDTTYGNAKAELTALLEQVEPLLEQADTSTQTYKDVKFNYELVVRSRDLGAHNFKYSKALLENGVELLSPSEPEFPAWDVTQDGTVDIQDLVVIGRNFGLTIEGNPVPNPDVTGDGVVDIQDLVTIGLHFGETTLEVPTAPSFASVPVSRLSVALSSVQDGHVMATVLGEFGTDVAGYQLELYYDDSVLELVSQSQGDLFPVNSAYWREGTRVQGALKDIVAARLGESHQQTRHGALASLSFRVKHASADLTDAIRLTNARLAGPDAQLLPYHIGYAAQVVSTPDQTRLLANYPNPFNPETWIPYQLAAPAEVVLEIYSNMGQIVRKIDVGYRSAGYHLTRNDAVYWDGLTTTGERVASGVYYYRLIAGDFSETRKMVILK